MGSSDRLFNRQRSLHEIFGGGYVADVILWRRKNVSVGILLLTVASWMMFERSGYTLLSLVSNVLLLLYVTLFLWAKSAAILNRPPPPLPVLHLSEEMVSDAAVFIRTRMNTLLSVTQDVALGKDTKLFFKIAAHLLLISIIGGLSDLVTLVYISLLIVLTIPALYDRCEDIVDESLRLVHKKSQQLYVKFEVECIGRIRKWILEKQKLS